MLILFPVQSSMMGDVVATFTLYLPLRISEGLCTYLNANLWILSHSRLFRTRCAPATKVQAALGILQYLPFAAFSSLRVLALSRMNGPLAVSVFILSIGPAVTNFVWTRDLWFKCCDDWVPTYGQCHRVAGKNAISAVSRTSLIVADVVVIIVTIFSTRNGRAAPLRRLRRSSLGDVLFFNGVQYFSVLLVLNVLQVVLTHISVGSASQGASYIMVLSDPYVHRFNLTAVLVCRFLCDLQSASKDSVQLGSGLLQSSLEEPEVESLGFARVLGSLGGQ
ncbi:hypothetical protein C8Q78DRAFT_373824 [Trametes maxima]|nr:hypothetical protein C8Q78DRAFT_373824 [Trametes maxima]